ncbi:MAG: nitrilase-related carbon-nitrogen hydrolase [Pseudomonadota bacterium]
MTLVRQGGTEHEEKGVGQIRLRRAVVGCHGHSKCANGQDLRWCGADRRPDRRRESDRVGAGDELPVFETAVGPVGVSVCSDLRFPEVYRELALKGAQVIVCASAFLSPRLDHWEFFLRARATENQCWVVASGQVGVEPKSGTAFVGRSMVVDPWGVIVATAPDTECCITVDIDLDHIDEVKRRYPLMDQRRPELYGNIGRAKAKALG